MSRPASNSPSWTRGPDVVAWRRRRWGPRCEVPAGRLLYTMVRGPQMPPAQPPPLPAGSPSSSSLAMWCGIGPVGRPSDVDQRPPPLYPDGAPLVVPPRQTAGAVPAAGGSVPLAGGAAWRCPRGPPGAPCYSRPDPTHPGICGETPAAPYVHCVPLCAVLLTSHVVVACRVFFPRMYTTDDPPPSRPGCSARPAFTFRSALRCFFSATTPPGFAFGCREGRIFPRSPLSPPSHALPPRPAVIPIPRHPASRPRTVDQRRSLGRRLLRPGLDRHARPAVSGGVRLGLIQSVGAVF